MYLVKMVEVECVIHMGPSGPDRSHLLLLITVQYSFYFIAEKNSKLCMENMTNIQGIKH